ncbi:MAG TPA: hypothetical protein VKY92_22805 [Verrucomicrobiae bacterium]|nr:hypothetical protein [Verrucomicrobiae bacterium]
MTHHPPKPVRTSRENASALLVTMLVTSIALVMVASIVAYSNTNARLNVRAHQYHRALAAAEAATEKATGLITRDYLSGGESLVQANLNSYQQSVPQPSESDYWSDWQFTDGRGNAGKTYVNLSGTNAYVVLNSTYAGLKGYATTYTVVSNAKENGLLQDVTGAVLQQVQLVRVPIFQFAMYSSGDMEISCGQPFTITGRVHSNGQLYIEPDSLLTFQSAVTSVGNTLFQRDPLDSRGPPVGSVIYETPTASHVPAMTLPIGLTNTPTAVREIIEPPAAGEDPNSPLGKQRYFNQADVLIVVTNLGTNFSVAGSSGRFNNFSVPIPTNELNTFISTSATFYDARENKQVQPIDINVGALTAWSATNSDVRNALGSRDTASIYVLDARHLSGTALGAVRLRNGAVLPPRGLTIATGSPMYVWGNYNQYSPTNLATANTSTTYPASLAADAITILSPNWTDANSSSAVALRLAAPTTVNAALLAGAVDTANGAYGGGMENFPRFLETWGAANSFWFNGSMVKMFPSLYATNTWGGANVYSPPTREWAYDVNFDNPAKLPPLTPGLFKVLRSLWTTVGPNQTAVPSL